MKNIITMLIAISLVMACKNDGALKTAAKVEYPAVYLENNVPVYTDGIISNTQTKEGDLKNEEIVLMQTDASFDDLHHFYIDLHSDGGWKLTKNTRKGIGGVDELMVLVFTKGKLKHGLTVLTVDGGKRQVKSTLSYFN